MKVLHLVPQMFGPGGLFGGAERYATELARAMAPHTPTRLVGFGHPARRREGSLDVFTLRNHLPGERFEVSPLGLGLWKHLLWADVVHCHQVYTMGTSFAVVYSKIWHKPVFLTDHAGGGVSLDSHVKLEAAGTARLWVSRMSQSASSVPPQPADTIIYGGVDTQLFCPGAPPLPSAPALYVGRVLRGKGVHHLVAAADADTPVKILGPAYDEPYMAELRQLAEGKQISFAPPVDGVELVRAYQGAACLVLPRIEQLGLTALEAMACGRPVVATEGSGICEILEEGRTGWSIPLRDHAALGARISWIRSHPAEAAAVGRAGRERVLADFTWDAVARRCLAAYATATSTAVGSSTRHKSSAANATR